MTLRDSDTPVSSASSADRGTSAPGAASSRSAASMAASRSSSAARGAKTTGMRAGPLSRCCPDRAHERSHSEPCGTLERVEGFAAGHPAAACAGRPRWILLPRHFRRVWLAAHRAAACDEQGELCDDWVIHGLRVVRRDALRAGYSRDDVDAWTMEGCLAGRRKAVQRASAGEQAT
jgi:hypothetical protein